MNIRCLSLLAAFAAFTVCQADPPQYTVVLLNPAGSNYGFGFGIGHGQQVGTSGIDAAGQRPSLWTGTAASFVNLLPNGYVDGEARATDGTHQFGSVYDGVSQWAIPAMWSGSAASFVNMSPAVSSGGWILGCDGTRQVGTNILGNLFHAGLWSGTPQSFVDINPTGYLESEANDIHGDLVGGDVVTSTGIFAFEWNLATHTTRNLNPNGVLSSKIFGTDGHQHAGYTDNGINTFSPHAGVWDVTSGLFTDLHPAGSLISIAYDVHNGTQVGVSFVGPGTVHAVTWNSTPESVLDLNQFLPAGTPSSEAYGIDENGNIIGDAIVAHPEPVMWIPLHQNPPPYQFLGFFAPLNDPASPESTYQVGRTIPIKFQLKNSDGLIVISATSTVSLEKWNGSGWSTVAPSAYQSPADDGVNVRFDPESDQYIYNLDTKNLDPGRYRITVTVADTQQTHSDTFTLTAKPGKGH